MNAHECHVDYKIIGWERAKRNFGPKKVLFTSFATGSIYRDRSDPAKRVQYMWHRDKLVI